MMRRVRRLDVAKTLAFARMPIDLGAGPRGGWSDFEGHFRHRRASECARRPRPPGAMPAPGGRRRK
jgi:hypothetical protein